MRIKIDWQLVAPILLLVSMGIAVLVSGVTISELPQSLFFKQLLSFGIGLVGFFMAARIPYYIWQRFAMWIYAVGLTLVIFTIATGAIIRGTVSRLELWGSQLQSPELMKLGVVMMLAWFLARYERLKLTQVALSALFMAIPTGLVLAEPDFGVAALFIACWLGMIVFSGISWRLLMSIGLVGLLLGGVAWSTLLLDYQKDRIRTFIDPSADPLRSGYNVTQSMIAFGSGQLLGRGLGHGPQSQLNFLPERHTDFIVASIGEELGFIGITVLIILYIVLLRRLLQIAMVTRDPFGQYMAVGIFCILLASFSVSIGMNMGLLPVTGIPLPFVSYGGSNMVTSLFLLGLAQSIQSHSHFMQHGAREIGEMV
jgi:rod shape determining protein RodA